LHRRRALIERGSLLLDDGRLSCRFRRDSCLH